MTFRLGRLVISRYVAMLYLGCVAGTLVGAAIAGEYGMDETRFALATIVLIVPAIVGSRLWFLVQHAPRIRASRERLWNRGDGGMGLYGGLVLSFALSAPVLSIAGLPFWRFWDATTFTFLVGLFLTRLGCTMQGCCAGRPTTSRLGIELADHNGDRQRRFPTPLLEAAWAVVAIAVALIARPHIDSAGTLAAVTLGAYAAVRLVLEPTREASREPRILRGNLAFSAALLLVSAATVAALS